VVLKPPKDKKRRIRREYLDLLEFSAIGLEMSIAIVIGAAIGYYLDKHFVVTKPWLTLTFMMFGIAAAFKSLWRTATAAKKKLDQINREQGYLSPEDPDRKDQPPDAL
jgi:ATP synthase protein I